MEEPTLFPDDSLTVPPVPDNIDDSDEKAYLQKCEYLDHNPFFSLSPCYLYDYLETIFARPFDSSVPEEPFEEQGSKEYQKWLNEVIEGRPHDYSENQFHYNPLAFFKEKRSKPKVSKKTGKVSEYKNTHRIIFRDDWASQDFLQSRYFALMAPITYVGKSTQNKNARFLYAFTIDLDGVGMEQLEALFIYMSRPWSSGNAKGYPVIPIPNIIVNSGHGLHLYYTMKYPLALFEENVKYLQRICKGLYDLAWFPKNDKNGEPGTTTVKKLQCLGVYHAFRMPETRTKPLRINKDTNEPVGEGLPIRAWLTDTPHYTISDFAPYLKYSEPDIFKPAVIEKLERGGRMHNPKRPTLEQARKIYGEDWYNNRGKEKKTFVIDRPLYDWWLNRLKDNRNDEVKEGHRYYCIMALASFAKKCGIGFDELKKDAYSLIKPFDDLTAKQDNHFTSKDVDVALKAYSKPNSIRWKPEMLAAWTGMSIKRTKRNRRDQETHLARNRVLQAYDDPEGTWRNKDGRPVATKENSKEATKVARWRAEHPDSHNKSQCARDLRMSRTTVTKWWE